MATVLWHPGRLLAMCDHLRKFLRNLKAVEKEDEIMIHQVILWTSSADCGAGKEGWLNLSEAIWAQ
jgi:hypothetical protein